jgi:hypothetical protein
MPILIDMKKLLLLIPTLLLVIASAAQSVTLKLKSAETKNVNVKASTNTQLMTDQGNFNYQDIDSLTFNGYRDQYKTLNNKLVNSGVKVKLGNEKPVQQSPIIASQNQSSTNVVMDYNLEQFNSQRSAGKVLQMLGGIAIGTGLFMTMSEWNKAVDANATYEPKKLPVALAIGGTAAMTIGFVIDISASKYLKR